MDYIEPNMEILLLNAKIDMIRTSGGLEEGETPDEEDFAY